MHPNAIRASFLDYFEKHGHRIVPSSPLVPADDPTLLFTNAGMNQFKDVFLGREQRGYQRAATAQKCMRVSGKHNDLENVGPSLRHHTFFEMLGNFSFGDYFKADAIPLAWKLLTREWGLDPNRLYATVFRGEGGVARDEEAYRIWAQFLPADQLGELGAADNFWAMGETGPCGRCSEIYYDRGPDVPGTGRFVEDVESGSERFVEIWNNVFMEFERDASGALTPLPAPSIDTGMGLERISAVLQGSLSNYDTELFTPLLSALGTLAGRQYQRSMSAADVSMRVIADHVRATTFLIADGVVPSNEWRGYVLRKIMRRAMRHARKLGLERPFLSTLVDVLVREMGGAYPELAANRDAIARTVQSEEARFQVVLSEGLPRLEEALDRAGRGSKQLPAEEAFRLYDTFGLPRDFIEDLANAQGIAFDTAGFEHAMGNQRERARASTAFKAREVDFPPPPSEVTSLAVGEFVGYSTIAADATVVGLWSREGIPVDELHPGSEALAVLTPTPFYVEAGGQVSDQGTLRGAQVSADVTGVLRIAGWPRLHAVRVREGVLRAGDAVHAAVERARRDAIRRNHTGTHLLHAALREVLSSHVRQAGSLVASDRLRFDFLHPSAVSPAQLNTIERRVAEAIVANEPVRTVVRDTQEAIASGAMALFGEKYGDTVRVVSVGDGRFSTELCGGTHVTATGEIGSFVITEEAGVAAGVRRIEALTGLSASAFLRDRLDRFEAAARALNAAAGDLAAAIATRLSTEAKLKKEVQQLKAKLAAGGGASNGEERHEIGSATLITREVPEADKDALRTLADTLKSKLTSGVVVLAGPTADGRVAIVASVTPDLKQRAPAGTLVKRLAPIVGGGGGGRPDFAEAGGKEPAKIRELLDESRRLVGELLTTP